MAFMRKRAGNLRGPFSFGRCVPSCSLPRSWEGAVTRPTSGTLRSCLPVDCFTREKGTHTQLKSLRFRVQLSYQPPLCLNNIIGLWGSGKGGSNSVVGTCFVVLSSFLLLGCGLHARSFWGPSRPRLSCTPCGSGPQDSVKVLPLTLPTSLGDVPCLDPAGRLEEGRAHAAHVSPCRG